MHSSIFCRIMARFFTMGTGQPFSSTAHPALANSRFLAFFDECGDHSLTKIDPDFPLFVLALVVVERAAYREVILPEVTRLKLRYWNHEGINLHSREIRLAEGPFNVLLNPHVRPTFMDELTRMVELLPFTLFVSAIHKRQHLQRCGPAPDDPYALALKFTVEPLLHFLDASGETELPIVAEARGKNEDHALRQDFTDILALATAARSAAQQRPLDLTLSFQPKRNNIAGNQIADLCAYPCARHILNPSRSNPPYEIVRKKLYQKGGVSGWKLFP